VRTLLIQVGNGRIKAHLEPQLVWYPEKKEKKRYDGVKVCLAPEKTEPKGRGYTASEGWTEGSQLRGRI